MGKISRTVFSKLIGQWTLARDITSADTGEGQLVGVCSFTVLDNAQRLLVEESGTLHMNGVESDVSRSYVYELRDDVLVILYNDPHRKGDVLHELTFAEDDGAFRARHRHLCGEDVYSLDFSVLEDGQCIEMDYIVTGPKKDYRMRSVLVPVLKAKLFGR